jgi:hypothetical protein
MRRFVVGALIAAAFQPGLSHAAATSGTSSFAFLNIPVGARATALGQAFTAVPNDVQALAYNPASLGTLLASQVSFEHLNYVSDVTQEAILFGHAGRQEGFSWGASANYLRVGDITRTVATLPGDNGNGFTETGNFSTYDMSLGVSGAAPVTDDLVIGTTVKLIRESLADASSNAGAVDLGVVYEANDTRTWSLAAAVQNLGFASKFADASVKLPYTFRGGVSAQPFAQWLFSADYVRRSDLSGEFDGGVEVRPQRVIALRFGYRYALTHQDLGGISDFSAGIGLRGGHWSFDYAFVPLGELGSTHRLSVNFRFTPQRD